MVKTNLIEMFRRFAFYLSVGDADQVHGLAWAKDTVHGLELGRAHFPDRPSIMSLFRELPPEAELAIVMVSGSVMGPDGGPERKINYHLGLDMDGGEAIHLPIELDACQNGPAYERVLLPHARFLGIEDTKCRFPVKPPPIDIVFDGPPAHESGRFVEVEIEGKSVSVGEWIERPDGYWVLRIER